MPLKGTLLILVIAVVYGIAYHKQIYKSIKDFFDNNKE